MTIQKPKEEILQKPINEKYFSYRLIKVLYIFSLLIALLLSGLIFFGGQAYFAGLMTFFSSYVILNIIRETLLYVAFGKKFSWDWIKIENKFIQQTRPAYELDPSTAAALLVSMLIQHESPYIKDEIIDLDENLKALVISAISGYVTYFYLSLIKKKFGQEISDSVLNHIIMMLNRESNLGDQINNLLTKIKNATLSHMPFERDKINYQGITDIKLIAIDFLVTINTSPYYMKPEVIIGKDYHTIFDEIISKIDDKIFSAIIGYLEDAKKKSQKIFTPLINVMEFKKESIIFLNVSPEMEWSQNPACYERFLKRKYLNPLIEAKDKAYINQDLINQARAIDTAEYNKLAKDLQEFYANRPKELGPIEASNQLDNQRSEISNLLTRCYQSGGPALEFRHNLQELLKATIECWKILLAGNKEQLAQLNKAEEYSQKVDSIFHNEFVSQLVRDNSPIKNDSIALALFEDPATLKSYFLSLGKDQGLIDLAKKELGKWIDKAKEEGIAIPMLDEKLEIISSISASKSILNT